jgi:hypothetical protein
MEKWKAEKRFPLSHSHDYGYGQRCLRRLQGEPGQLVHPMSTGDRRKTPGGPSQMERPGFESPLCAMSTNRSLSATIRKYLWTGAAFFIEG